MTVVLQHLEKSGGLPPGGPSPHRPGLDRGVKSAQVALDLAAIAVAVLAVTALTGSDSDRSGALLLGLAATPVWLGFLAAEGLYVGPYLTSHLAELRRILLAVARSAGAVAVLVVVLGVDVHAVWLPLWTALATPLLVAERELIRREVLRLRRHGELRRRVLVVGANDEAAALIGSLTRDPTLGYEVVGVVADDADSGMTVGGRPVDADVRSMLDVAGHVGAAGVMVATTAIDAATCDRVVREATDAGLHLELSTGLRDITPTRLTVRSVGRHPVFSITGNQLRGWRRAAKRSLDIAVSAGGLVLVLPVLAAAAVAIQLDSPGGVFFRQERVGKNGRPFRILKLRTMVDDAEALRASLLHRNEADGPLFKIDTDPRVTRVGRVLRRLSIDELPQLWNVLRGDMSLVGPRPALPSEVDAWHESLFARLRVKPGITGMWQVGGRSNASFEEYQRLDLYYVDNWSLVSDLAILARTVPAVLLRRGAA